MKVLIAGATGLVGKKLMEELKRKGFGIHFLTTNKDKLYSSEHTSGFYWNPEKNEIDAQAFDGVGIVINLAGASISKKWSKAHKKDILESRIYSGKTLYDYLKNNKHTVTKYVSASAIGIYENSLENIYDETTVCKETGFLSKVCIAWEETALQFENLGIATTVLRIGVVFNNEDSALQKMVAPFQFYAGAALASGKQYVSWIHIEDLVQAFVFILQYNKTGIYNAVSPYPLTNKELTKAIGKQLKKPIILPNVPLFMLKILLGEMHCIVTESQNVRSRKLLNEGFQFKYPTIEKALQQLL